jgi:hypothetical protein
MTNNLNKSDYKRELEDFSNLQIETTDKLEEIYTEHTKKDKSASKWVTGTGVALLGCSIEAFFFSTKSWLMQGLESTVTNLETLINSIVHGASFLNDSQGEELSGSILRGLSRCNQDLIDQTSYRMSVLSFFLGTSALLFIFFSQHFSKLNQDSLRKRILSLMRTYSNRCQIVNDSIIQTQRLNDNETALQLQRKKALFGELNKRVENLNGIKDIEKLYTQSIQLVHIFRSNIVENVQNFS